MDSKRDKANAKRRRNYARNKRKQQTLAKQKAKITSQNLAFEREWNNRESNRKKSQKCRSKKQGHAEDEM